MNPFDQKLQAAKKRQNLLYLSMAMLFLISILVLAGIILATRGTRIEVQPMEAAMQSTMRVHAGFAFIVGDTLYAVSKNPTIEVSAAGFQVSRKMLDDADFGKVMRVVLLPLPARVTISTNISISDDQTMWLLGDTVLATARMLEYELPAGVYDLMVRHKYYQDQIIPLSLARGEVFSKNIVMSPVNGLAQINTTPSGATVSVNSVAMGVPPLQLELLGGEYRVSVALSGYQTIQDVFEISRDLPKVQRDYRLLLHQTTVRTTLSPRGGKLHLDGIVVKNTDQIAVTAGTIQRLKYSKDGYLPQSRSFNVAVGEVLQLDFALKKGFGQVTVESSPLAEVTINGQAMGITPLNLSLQTVAQTITLSKAGFRSVTKVLTPSMDHGKKIHEDLLPERVVQLQEAAKQYTNKVGVMLKLFTPNDVFTMGAKRSESEQRANEFVRKIKLTEPFYAGVHEVTHAQYSQYKKGLKTANPQYPVTSVSWLEAVGFCNWLSQQEQLTPVYQIENNRLQGVKEDANGYRLLTEAEWEWLARKAGKSKQTIFVWGDSLVIPKRAANIADVSSVAKVKVFVPKYDDTFVDLAPVGQMMQEKSGLYDQGGNVSEWTHDGYAIVPPVAGQVMHDPFDTKISRTHVVKGASWRSGSLTELRPAFREGRNDRHDDLGFRVARYVYKGE
ncbi:serine/threonine kinase [uncultured Candidatus Thioglobus sp.]|nr:serine/threonine kinase [uncultured Candidatus Thioglobus sp.]